MEKILDEVHVGRLSDDGEYYVLSINRSHKDIRVLNDGLIFGYFYDDDVKSGITGCIRKESVIGFSIIGNCLMLSYKRCGEPFDYTVGTFPDDLSEYTAEWVTEVNAIYANNNA